MSKNLTPANNTKDVQAFTPQEQRARDNFTARRSPATQRAYESDWRIWCAWAELNEVREFPTTPETVALFASDMSEGRKISTIRRYINRISVYHMDKGVAFDNGHPALRGMMQGIARNQAMDPEKAITEAKPFTADMLNAMWSIFPDDSKGIRDRALLALGIASAFRRSELVELDWKVYGTGKCKMEPLSDGAKLHLRTSKASQGKADYVHIHPGRALRAVNAWVEHASIEPSTPLFRGITKGGRISAERLFDDAVNYIIRKRLKEAGVDPQGFSGHSLRAGMATSAANAGIPESQIKTHTRHKSDSMVRRYIRDIDKKKASPTREMGL